MILLHTIDKQHMKDTIYPDVSGLAVVSGLNLDSVRESLKKLRRLGFLNAQYKHGENADHRVYRVQEDKNSVKSFDEITAALREAAARSGPRKILAPRKNALVEEGRPLEVWTFADVHALFNARWCARWVTANPPKLTAKDRAQMKTLLSQFGASAVKETILMLFADWDNIRQEFQLSGFPSYALLYGYRNSLIPRALEGPQKKISPKNAPRSLPQFDSTYDREDGNEGGW